VSEARLLVRLDARGERDELLRFLRERGCRAEAEGETSLAVPDCEQVPPGLAVLVALVEEWRAAAHVPEAVLELGDRRTILRTES
jgi:hypothetical protein